MPPSSPPTKHHPVVQQSPKPTPKLYEPADPPVTSRKTVISRSTSPTPELRAQFKTRIARTTEPIVVEIRRSRKPRLVDASCQTDVTEEFGTLAEYLNPPPPPKPVVLKDPLADAKEVNTLDERYMNHWGSRKSSKIAAK